MVAVRIAKTMFRIHCMQQWYSLGDEAMEDALYELLQCASLHNCHWIKANF